MRRLVLAGVLIFTGSAIGSDAPDEFRQSVRSDPLIQTVIGALRKKHGGCPSLDSPHGDGGMWVMKEVEPYSYSEPTDSYELQPARLEVHLTCFHAVSASVYTYYYEEAGPESIAKLFESITFSYDGFAGYLRRYRPSTTEPEESILRDPLVVGLYDLLIATDETCEEITDGRLQMNEELEYRIGEPNVLLHYRPFSLTYTCDHEGSGDIFEFEGNLFTRSGFVTWQRFEKSGWVN